MGVRSYHNPLVVLHFTWSKRRVLRIACKALHVCSTLPDLILCCLLPWWAPCYFSSARHATLTGQCTSLQKCTWLVLLSPSDVNSNVRFWVKHSLTALFTVAAVAQHLACPSLFLVLSFSIALLISCIIYFSVLSVSPLECELHEARTFCFVFCCTLCI